MSFAGRAVINSTLFLKNKVGRYCRNRRNVIAAVDLEGGIDRCSRLKSTKILNLEGEAIGCFLTFLEVLGRYLEVIQQIVNFTCRNRECRGAVGSGLDVGRTGIIRCPPVIY